MKTKHRLIEILPRLLWVIEGLTLYFLHERTGRSAITQSNVTLLLVGVTITIFGMIYLVNTFYKLFKPMFTKELVTDGPYKNVRHPMYAAMYVLLIGIGITFFSWLWFVILLLFVPCWYLDCLLEESQMTDLHGDKYREYKSKTGMFIPKIF